LASHDRSAAGSSSVSQEDPDKVPDLANASGK
jgi:hypothetical protein